MQMYLLSVSTVVVFCLAVGFLVVRAWMRWAQRNPDHSVPKWRSWIAVGGFAASNVSLLMIMLLMGSGYFSHAYIPDTPLGSLALRVTFFTALAGILTVFVGIGKLTAPTTICSLGGFLALVIHWLGR
ncbi:MAG: hypothetical protein WBF04_09350 [Candidatus Sulfotelmatobacter sp.]